MGRACLNILVAICLLLSAARLRAEPITLVENGKSDYSIFISPNPSATEQFAAEELAKYVKQMTGVYRVKHPDMIPLNEEAHALLAQFKSHKFEHNLRHKNETADKLANLAMDRKADVTDVDESPIDAPTPRETEVGDQFACPRCGCVISVEKPSSIRPHQLKPFVCQCGNKMNPIE